MNGRPLKLFGCLLAETSGKGLSPGRVKDFTEKGIEIETGMGTVIVKEFQSPGKRRMPAGAFIQGSRIGPGSILGN